MIVRPDDPGAADVRELLQAHLVLMRSQSEPGDVHALDVEALQGPGVALLSCREEGLLLGVGALAPVSDSLAEVKSMHTAVTARGRGVARRVLAALLDVAEQQGFSHVSLETGSQAAFAPARALYAAAGFLVCPAFGAYRPSGASTFMTRELPLGEVGARSPTYRCQRRPSPPRTR